MKSPSEQTRLAERRQRQETGKGWQQQADKSRQQLQCRDINRRAKFKGSSMNMQTQAGITNSGFWLEIKTFCKTFWQMTEGKRTGMFTREVMRY